MKFDLHQHGTGLQHYSFENHGTVFEIYPLATGDSIATGLRIGFAVSSLDAIVAILESANEVVVSPPKASPWGRRAVVQDPDGYKVELTEGLSSSQSC
jgi:predicted enzyme related to lactoylglutathione lyase